VSEIAQLRFLPVSFAIQFGIRVCLGLVRVVGPLLSSELAAFIVVAVFLLKALLARPGLDQRTVHREVFVG
jgi:hypothetical protein